MAVLLAVAATAVYGNSFIKDEEFATMEGKENLLRKGDSKKGGD